MPLSLDSKTEYYINTVAHRASFSLAIVQQRRGPKMQPHRVQLAQPHITMPTGSIQMPIMDISIFQVHSGGPSQVQIFYFVTV